jgi:probable HAF family extracellular repeat protein
MVTVISICLTFRVPMARLLSESMISATSWSVLGIWLWAGLNRFHGFLWKEGVYTTIDAPDPEETATSLLGINKAGQIIGAYLHHRPGSNDINDYDSELTFLYDNGNFKPLAFPGAKLPFLCCGATTFPMDINNLGQVIGSTYASDGEPQFFLYENGEYFVITGLPENVVDANDLSVVHGSSAWGMNDLGEIAGTYVQRVPCDACGFEGGPGYHFKTRLFRHT